ncbi:MAG TPA: DUF3601 domain-containing protein [Allosphingosinicella sp.]|nr:DUF3601 domain-containing protein [Allosphingosinicella sp.]
MAMYGPCPAGHWTRSLVRADFGPLKAGARYRVARAFRDFDGDMHEIDEAWIFLGSNFLPYEDGLSLFVSLDGEQEWHIRLCWRPQDQGDIIDGLGDYLLPG